MNESNKAFNEEVKTPLAVVPVNNEAGTVKVSPTANPDPPLTTDTDEIDPVVPNVTFNTAPAPDKELVAATAL